MDKTVRTAAHTRGSDDPIAVRSVLGVGFTSSVVATVVLNGDLQCVVANAAAQKLLTLGRTSLVGRNAREFCSQAWVTRTPRQRAAALRSGAERLQRQAAIVSAGSERLRLEATVDVVAGPGGQMYFLVQLRDVSEERRREAELVFSEVRYRQLAWELSDSAVTVFGADLGPLQLAGRCEPEEVYDPGAVQRLRDIIPAHVLGQLEPRLRASRTGEPWAYEYANPGPGRQVRVLVHDLTDPAGRSLGFLAVSAPVVGAVAESGGRDPVGRLARVGRCSYDSDSGWDFDDALLDLWGIDRPVDPWAVIDDIVVEQDRTATRAGWARIAGQGGQCTIAYRIRHGHNPEPVHLLSTFEAVVDVAGRLLRATATHVDVTDGVAARWAERSVEGQAADERTRLLRRVSDSLATTDAEFAELTQNVVELASAVLGDGAVLRVLSPQGLLFDFHAVAHRTERGRQRMLAGLHEPASGFPIFRAAQAELIGRAQLVSSVFEHPLAPHLRDFMSMRLGENVQHFIVAPVRHRGQVLANLTVFRVDPGSPYTQQDVDLVQVMADRLSAAIIDNRAAQAVAREQAETQALSQRLGALRTQQGQLLVQLASTEARERARLAEAVHDDPLQLITAAIFRLDLLHDSPVTEAAAEEVGQVAELLATSVEQLRHLLVSLTPPDLSDGLGGAVLRLAEAVFIGTKTTVAISGARRVQIDVARQASIYRIMREALNNVRKHAFATTVTLQLQERDDHVVVSLIDDGVGSASMDAGPGHLGLATMRARAAAEGIDLTVDSAPGQGTQVHLRTPSSLGSVT